MPATFQPRTQSKFHSPQCDNLVLTEMQDSEIIQLAYGLDELGESFRLFCAVLGPE
jgi:hypothetical protein